VNDDRDEHQPSVPPPPFVPAPNGITEIYCNYYNINWSLFDVRIRLAQLIPTADANTAGAGPIKHVAQERAALTMAWPEAKLLRDALSDAVEKYERVNGELKALKMPKS
jgi:hypothetical protein